MHGMSQNSPPEILPETAQGTPGWHAQRLGKVTASRLSDVMAKGRKGEPSLSRAKYMAQLVCERIGGAPLDTFQSAAMKAGTETEPVARAMYAFMTDAVTLLAPFVPHPKIENSGASPDSFVGNDGLLEIKCPLTHTHLETLLGGAISSAYIMQMQWQMACTGRLWCDFVSFDPRMPAHMQMHTTRVPRDSKLIMEMESAVRVFLAEMDEMIADLNKLYPAPKQEAAE